MSEIRNVCLLGFGEVGSVLADALGERRVSLVAWDRQFHIADSVSSRHAARRKQVRRAASAEAAAAGCELVISAVTAAQDFEATGSVLGSLERDAWFLDLNSVSPVTRQSVADLVQHSRGRYVEAAVMSPIHPDGVASPMLAGGPHARAFIPVAHSLGFSRMTFCSDRTGLASATKMCRSVVVKGMESLLIEALLAARRYGVDEAVIASLDNLFKHRQWAEQGRYMISRSLMHGVRRSEEMREVARTIGEAGIDGWMSEACARSQERAAQLAPAADTQELGAMLDALLAILQPDAAPGERVG